MNKNIRFWLAIAFVCAVVGYLYMSDNRVNVDCSEIAINSLKKYNLEDPYQIKVVTESCIQGVALAKAGGSVAAATAASTKIVEDKLSGEKTNGAKFTAFIEGYTRESSFH